MTQCKLDECGMPECESKCDIVWKVKPAASNMFGDKAISVICMGCLETFLEKNGEFEEYLKIRYSTLTIDAE